MGRWTDQDSDEARLPAGMERIGYDSDTGRYYFRDGSGSVWQGAQGAQFSEMTRVSARDGGSSSSYPPNEDVEAAPRRADGYQALATDANGRYLTTNASAYRTLFPFFLLIGVVMLLVWRLILSPGLSAPKNPCSSDATGYLVQPGDSCWEISHAHGLSLDDFKKLNKKVNCDALMPGTTVCLPNQPPDHHV
ncbi:Peptidoglycan-binding domain protein [Mycena sanguinolenta]|uniref:Peptidoglycan-binding domain protein n=1 Tax=Mycena sanguinolenta TaxID=230812 RepID=A0A8H6XGD9_9AGAR|nr:Peptidoglycan-binding domain protein [Mycena sanguinolenta]